MTAGEASALFMLVLVGTATASYYEERVTDPGLQEVLGGVAAVGGVTLVVWGLYALLYGALNR